MWCVCSVTVSLQGLGKTVQAIAFLAHLYESGLHGMFLIIVPTSTMGELAVGGGGYVETLMGELPPF